MAERFAVDYDEDDIYNLDEAPGREYSSGSTASKSVPKIIYTKLQWHTTRVAKINLDTNKYTTVVATATPSADPAGIAVAGPVVGDERISVSKRFAKTHEVFFKDLVPGTHYEVTIKATDRGKIPSRPARLSIDTAQIDPIGQVATDLHLENVTVTPGDDGDDVYSLTFDLVCTIVKKGTTEPWVHPQGGEGAKILTQVLVGSEMVIGVLEYLEAAIPSDDNGRAVIPGITISDLSPGDEICVDMLSFLWSFTAPNGTEVLSFTHFCFPLTAPENRGLKFLFCPDASPNGLCQADAVAPPAE